MTPSALLVVDIGQLVTLAAHKAPVGAAPKQLDAIADAAVLAVDGSIVAAGPAEAVLRAVDASLEPLVVSADGAIVVPGLVDCHSHLLYAGDRTDEYWMRLGGADSCEVAANGGGLARTVTSSRAASVEQLLKSLLSRLDATLAAGTTTVEVKSGYGLSVGAEVDQLSVIAAAGQLHAIDVVPTWFGAHGYPPELSERREDYIAQLIEEQLPAVASLAYFCDVLCDRGAFEPPAATRILDAARGQGLKLRLLADETSRIGGAELAAAGGIVAAAHLNHTSEAGLAALAAAGTIAIVLPATRLFRLTDRDPDINAMRTLQIPIALGTDHRPTSPLGSMLTVIALACGEYGLSPEQALLGATVNAAWAAGRGQLAGRLAPTMPADLVCLNISGYRELPAYLDRPLTRFVVKRGRLVFGQG